MRWSALCLDKRYFLSIPHFHFLQRKSPLKESCLGEKSKFPTNLLMMSQLGCDPPRSLLVVVLFCSLHSTQHIVGCVPLGTQLSSFLGHWDNLRGMHRSSISMVFLTDFYICFWPLHCPILEVQNETSIEHMYLVSSVMTNSSSCINESFCSFTQGTQLTMDHCQHLILFTSWFLWTFLLGIRIILTHKQKKMSHATSQLNFPWCTLGDLERGWQLKGFLCWFRLERQEQESGW